MAAGPLRLNQGMSKQTTMSLLYQSVYWDTCKITDARKIVWLCKMLMSLIGTTTVHFVNALKDECFTLYALPAKWASD